VELLFPVEKAASYSQEAKEKEDVQVVMGLDPLPTARYQGHLDRG